MTRKYKRPPVARQLAFLLGKWKTVGSILGDSEGAGTIISGSDKYELVAGGSFILHTVKVKMGKEKVEAVEMIGEYDADKNIFYLRSFDHVGLMTTMIGSIDKKKQFKIIGTGMRARLEVIKKGMKMVAYWDRSEDGYEWNPWMELIFTR